MSYSMEYSKQLQWKGIGNASFDVRRLLKSQYEYLVRNRGERLKLQQADFVQ